MPNPEIAPALVDLVMAKVVAAYGGCMAFTGTRNQKGYGRVYDGVKRHGAHRVAYEAAKGPIPKGLVIDHLCRNPRCVNPDHLEAVTAAENTRRGDAGLHRKQEAKAMTHCKHCHLRTPENVYRDKRGYGSCKPCLIANGRAWRARVRAEQENSNG